MNTFDLNAKYIVTPYAELKLYNQAYDILKKMTNGNEFRILSIGPDELDNIKSVTVQECGGPGIHTIRLSQREMAAFIRLAPKQLIDFDVVSTYVCPVKPLEIKEPTMTTAIEIGKTYKLVEPEIKTNALISGHKTLTDVFGEGEFIVEEFTKSDWFAKSYVIHGRRLDNNKVEKNLVYEAELILFQEVEEQDPTDLLCKPVSIRRPFDNPICGWVTDQWIEDGVELLNVVHAGDFSVVPRSAVVNVLN